MCHDGAFNPDIFSCRYAYDGTATNFTCVAKICVVAEVERGDLKLKLFYSEVIFVPEDNLKLDLF